MPVLGITLDSREGDQPRSSILKGALTTKDRFARLKLPDFILRNSTCEQVLVVTHMPRVYGAPTFDPFVDQGHIHAQRAIHHLRMPNY